MFEYSLENGKRQFKQGFILLIASVLFGILFAILILVIPANKTTAILVIKIIFSIILGTLLLLTFIKIIFGGVVYHAERTQSKSNKIIQEEYQKECDELSTQIENYTKQKNISKLNEIKGEVAVSSKPKNSKTIKKLIVERSEVEDYKYYNYAHLLSITLKNKKVLAISNFDDEMFAKWIDLDDQGKTDMLYSELIYHLSN